MKCTHHQWTTIRRRGFAVAGVVVCSMAVSTTANADRCYADTKMDVPNDYQSAVHLFGLGGTSTTAPQASNGNPGTFLRVDITVNSAPAAGQRSGVVCTYLFNGAVYDPSVDGGEIIRICYEEWAHMIIGVGDVQASGPVIRQTDSSGTLRYYRAAPSLTVGVASSWERRATTLKEADFSAIDPADVIDGLDQSLHPDFSAGASPLEFGVFRTNNTSPGAGGYSRSAALDSWSITVISEPCRADIDGDGVVGFLDLLKLLSAWGCTP